MSPISNRKRRLIIRGVTEDRGLAAQPGDAPFILHEDGLGWLYVPERLAGRSDADALRADRVAGR